MCLRPGSANGSEGTKCSTTEQAQRISPAISQHNETTLLIVHEVYRSAFGMRVYAVWKFVPLFQSGTAARKPSYFEIRRIATPLLALRLF